MTKQEFITRFIDPAYEQGSYATHLEVLNALDMMIHRAIAEHEATNIKLSPEIFNNVQLKRVARMLKELSEESWKAAGGDGREWNTWYLKRSTQHLNQSKEGGEG